MLAFVLVSFFGVGFLGAAADAAAIGVPLASPLAPANSISTLCSCTSFPNFERGRDEMANPTNYQARCLVCWAS